MLPSPERFLEGLAFFARRHAPGREVDAPGITAALAEASRLSAGREADEPAALFYACVRRSRSFGSLSRDFVPFITRLQAEAIGGGIEIQDIELDILRARILLGALTFEELCAELAARWKPRG